MAGQLGAQGAAMEQRELAALASVKNPNRPRRQQSLVVTGRSTGQQLAWLNAGAVADANIFNHPVRVCVFSRLRGHSLVLQLRTHAPHARTHARNARTHRDFRVLTRLDATVCARDGCPLSACAHARALTRPRSYESRLLGRHRMTRRDQRPAR